MDIAGGRDAVLELTAANADSAAIASGTTTVAAPIEGDTSADSDALADSVVTVWQRLFARRDSSPTRKGSSPRTIAWSAARRRWKCSSHRRSRRRRSPRRGWLEGRCHPLYQCERACIGSGRLAGLRTAVEATAPWTARRFHIRQSLSARTNARCGTREPRGNACRKSDFRLALEDTGGPVFPPTAPGRITSSMDEKDRNRRDDSRVVRVGEVRGLASAEKKMKDAAAPSATALPVEPVRPFPIDALKEAVKLRIGSLNPYQIASADFDIAFITPVQVYGAQDREDTDAAGRAAERRAAGDRMKRPAIRALARPIRQLVRVCRHHSAGAAGPRDAEAGGEFWTTVARGAAQRQGVALPAIEHFSRASRGCASSAATPRSRPSIRSRSNSASPRPMRSTKASPPSTPVRLARSARPSARALLGEGAREGGHPPGDPESAAAGLAGLRTDRALKHRSIPMNAPESAPFGLDRETAAKMRKIPVAPTAAGREIRIRAFAKNSHRGRSHRTRELIAGLLASEFDAIATASDGLQAVEAVAAFDPTLLLDITMPVLAVSRRLRESGTRRGRLESCS